MLQEEQRIALLIIKQQTVVIWESLQDKINHVLLKILYRWLKSLEPTFPSIVTLLFPRYYSFLKIVLV